MHPELTYVEGHRRALLSVLRHVHQELGEDSAEVGKTSWVIQRQEIVAKLRTICADYGDNDWPDDAHIPDVLESHLYRHLVKLCGD